MNYDEWLASDASERHGEDWQVNDDDEVLVQREFDNYLQNVRQ